MTTISEKLIQIAQNQQKVFDAGYNKGLSESGSGNKKEFLESFWNDFTKQANTGTGALQERGIYQYGFGYFTPEIFYPNTNLKMSYAQYSFYYFNQKGEYFDLKSRLEECGIEIDLSVCRDVSGMFQNAKINVIPKIDLTSVHIPHLNNMFQNTSVETVEKIILKSDGSQTFNNNSFNTKTLKNITFEGVIGSSVTFAACTLLTKASIESIISVLSTKATNITISGKTIDPSKIYTIAMPDYVANGGDQMEACLNAIARTDYPETIREMIIQYMEQLTSQGKTITSSIDGRITISNF